jgi:hypothetical protein
MPPVDGDEPRPAGLRAPVSCEGLTAHVIPRLTARWTAWRNADICHR